MKKVSAIILCLALICGVGCAKNEPKQQTVSFSISTEGKLSPSQYKAALEERWEMYRSANQDWVALMPEGGCDEPKEFAELRPQIEPIHDRMEAALVSYRDIIPPDEYKELHEKLIEGADIELEWLDCSRRMFSSKTERELQEATEKALEIVDTATENETSYPQAYLNVYMALKDDGVA